MRTITKAEAEKLIAEFSPPVKIRQEVFSITNEAKAKLVVIKVYINVVCNYSMDRHTYYEDITIDEFCYFKEDV